MRVPDDELYEIAMKEYSIVRSIQEHENIIKVVDFYFNKNQQKIYLVMEYVDEGFTL